MEKIKLNLGSSKNLIKGFINVDIGFDIKDKSFVKADVIELPFPDEYADYILARQLLEHLSISYIIPALKEWLRVLKTGGRMVITCPNFTLMAEEWLNTEFNPIDYHEMTQGLYGNQRTMYEHHLTPITPEFLNYCLLKAGAKTWRTEVHEKGTPFKNYPGCVEKKDRVYRYSEVHIDLIK
jgi:ubiquinone/menaquinone biosynthesis C-methylase UbiE